MESVKLCMAIAALAGAGLWLPAVAATPVANGATNAPPATPAATPAMPATPATPGQVPPASPMPAVHKGSVNVIARPASAASGARDGDDVQTTIEDGRKVTRNAHMPNAARVGSSPNN